VAHSTGQYVALHRAERVLDALDDEHLDAADDESELFVRMLVLGHDGARLELDQVQHRALAEERPRADARRKLERADVAEVDELGLRIHRRDYRCVVAEREEFRVEGLAEPFSHYTDAVRIGDLLFISGCVSVDAGGSIVGAGDVVAQARQVFTNIGLCLRAAGATFADVAKVTTFLTNIDDRARINPIREEFFGAAKPASTLVEVSKLVLPEFLIEVEAIARVPAR
jgi:2-iminobutanoate/2-iminopropanoate deaminase